jgi:BolA protein
MTGSEPLPPEKSVRVDAQAIDATLRSQLAPIALEVQDDGHLHAGHAGAREGGHYTVRIECTQFIGLSRLARHRLVYDALSELIPQGIHALAIDARAPTGQSTGGSAG